VTTRTPPRSILIIQLGDIGDVVLATASFHALKDRLPDARVHALVRKGCGALLAADPTLSGIFESRRGGGRLSDIGREILALARSLRVERFDLVIDLRTGDRSAILALLARGTEKVAYAGNGAFWRRFIFTRLFDRLAAAPLPAHPGADQSLRVLRAAGFDVGDFLPQLHVSGETDAAAVKILSAAGIPPGTRFVTINPFSRWKYKEWGYDRWTEVIATLGERHGVPSVLIGSEEESGEAAGILRKTGGAGRSIAGKTSLAELAAVLRRSTLHLGVDSAAPHMASALGTPTLTIFGPSDWRAWILPDETHRVVCPDDPCVPCHRKGCDHTEVSVCLDNMPTEKVLLEAEKALETVGEERFRAGK
jgi:ADP-heptose:LPS heptosyltransferase